MGQVGGQGDEVGGGKGVPTQFLNGLDLKKWERFPGGGENTLFLKTTLFLPLIHSQSPIPEPPARKEIRGEAVELAEVLNKSVGQPSPAAWASLPPQQGRAHVPIRRRTPCLL